MSWPGTKNIMYVHARMIVLAMTIARISLQSLYNMYLQYEYSPKEIFTHTTNKPAVAIFYYCFDPNNKMGGYGF